MSVGTFAINIVVGFIPFIGVLISLAVGILSTVLFIMGIVKVCKDEADPKLPIIGDLTMKLFANQIGEEVIDDTMGPIETAQEPVNENQENN